MPKYNECPIRIVFGGAIPLAGGRKRNVFSAHRSVPGKRFIYRIFFREYMKGDQQDISTGVDKLVEIINDKGKVEINQVAKMLGISKKVVEEWAHFLETKDIIQIKYFLTKTFLMKKEMSKEEIAKKQKDLLNKKDAIFRKAENFIGNMEKKCDVLEELRNDYNGFRKDIEEGLKNVKCDFNDIEKCHSKRRELQNGIFSEQSILKKKIEELSCLVQSKFNEFQDLRNEVKKEEAVIKEQQINPDKILEKEEKIYDQLETLEKFIKVLKKEIVEQSGLAWQEHNVMRGLEKKTAMLREHLNKREKEFPAIMDKLKKSEDELAKRSEEVKKKMSISPKANASALAEKFKKGMDTIVRIDSEIAQIFLEYDIIANELSKIVAEAKSINIIKDGKQSKQIEPLNEKLEELNQKKQFFEKHLSRLRLLIKE
jgi:chromosome segregation ATPase